MPAEFAHPDNQPHSRDVSLDDLVLEISELAEAGKVDEATRLIEQHPEYADRLNRLLPAIEALATLDNPTQEPGGPQRPQALGDFRIIGEIGRGGMAVVYEAEQLSLNRRMALKVLPLAATLSSQQLERFRNEARLAASLRHPHIVGVHSVGVERGVHYYAMELIEGCSLAQAIAAIIGNHEQSTNLDTAVSRTTDTAPVAELSTVRTDSPQEYFRKIAKLIADAADALEYAHSAGIVHRDIKPGNLLLDSGGKIYVTDFGLARLEADAGVTLTGDLLGTLRYMSPEQAAGESRLVDFRTDIHALGATLYELLVTRPVFGGSDRAKLLRRVVEETPTPLRQVEPRIPVDLETIVAKALEKEPADRYQSAADLASDLRAYLDHRAIEARPPSLHQRIAKWSRRHVGVVVTTTALLALLMCASVMATLLLAREQGRTKAALIEAQKQEVAAEQAAAESEALASFLVDDLLSVAEASRSRGESITVAEVVDRAEKELETRFSEQPLLEARIRIALAEVHASLSRHSRAEQNYCIAGELRFRELGLQKPTLRTRHDLYRTIVKQRDGSVDGAELSDDLALIEQLTLDCDRILGPTDEVTIDSLHLQSTCLRKLRKYEQAMSRLKTIEARAAAISSPRRKQFLAQSKADQAVLAYVQDHHAEAYELLREALVVGEGVLEPRDALPIKYWTGKALLETKSYTAAHEILSEVLPDIHDLFGPSHSHTLDASIDLADVLFRLAKRGERENLHRARQLLRDAAETAYQHGQWESLFFACWNALTPGRFDDPADLAKFNFFAIIAGCRGEATHIVMPDWWKNYHTWATENMAKTSESEELETLKNEAEQLLKETNEPQADTQAN